MKRARPDVLWTREVLDILRGAPRSLRRTLVDAGERLAETPAAGKGLTGELDGYRSVHAAGDRWRIVFRYESDGGRIIVVFVGRRRPGTEDVYEVARKLLRARLLDDE